MKKILTLSISIFSIGFILKFFHIHYNAIIMMTGLFLMLIVFTISSFKRNDDLNPLLGFSFTSWLVLLLFTIKYFPFVKIVLLAASILTIIAIGVTLRKRLISQTIMLGISFVIAITFYLTPTDSRYYLLSIKWNHEIETDFISWDKYSWHLYKNQKYEQSLKASDRAKQIISSSDRSEWAILISEHNDKIKKKNWKKYR